MSPTLEKRNHPQLASFSARLQMRAEEPRGRRSASLINAAAG